MEDQYFSNIHSNGLFDLNLSGCAPMGFSPSIDDTNTLSFSLGDDLEIPSFMFEVQRKRADTVTTLKPDFELKEVDKDGFEVDIPKRKRAAQRLSLASSIASSAPSTSASASDADGIDFNGFDSEIDARSSTSSPQDWNGQFSVAMQSTDSVSDLVHWRSNMTIQAAYHQQFDGQSPSSSVNAQGSEFSFAEFIDENPQTGAQDDDSAMQETVDSAQAISLASADSSGSLSSATSSSDNSEAASSTPSSSVAAADEKVAMASSNGLGLFGTEQNVSMDAVHLSTVPNFEQFAPQHGFVSPQFPAGSSMMSAYPSSMSHESGWNMSRPMGSMDAAMSMHPEVYRAHAMIFTQSAPAAQMAMYAPGMNGSPVPSSPAYSARSSSPFPSTSNGVFCSSPLVRSPASHQLRLQHLQDSTHGSSLPKGMNLLAHLANPYAGLITKRSRGRRVPSKPEEMNNLGKSGKVYTCKVPGCGKCFKRSEHLKRHVRSIHTDEKPYLCPFPNCHKRFSRHDNLNQHARVHATASSHPMHAGMPSVGQHGDGSSMHMNGMAPMALSQLSFGGMGTMQMKQEVVYQQGEGDEEEQTMALTSLKAEPFPVAQSDL